MRRLTAINATLAALLSSTSACTENHQTTGPGVVTTSAVDQVVITPGGALGAAGTMRLVYQMGGNGSLPRGFPIYYRLTK
jgi:hypothetical protein